VENSAKYRQLKFENEMLKAEKVNTTAELNEMLSILNDIQADIQSIREAENFLDLEQKKEFSPDQKEQLKSNMKKIAETLKSNREQLFILQEQLKKSNIHSEALQKTIDRIGAELNQKALMIAALQEELARKDIRLYELDGIVASLNENVENLAAQSARLSEQNKKLNTAYYCFGTKKELKEQNILTGGGLFSRTKTLQAPFNEDYFIAVDIREITEIPLYAHKAKVASNHPANSYEFVKDNDGNLTLRIVDKEQFWSLGRYLVIIVG
jgi:DNA repair exonuclease SbcCD ATPase subunit